MRRLVGLALALSLLVAYVASPAAGQWPRTFGAQSQFIKSC